MKSEAEGLQEADVAVVMAGPDEDGDYKLSNLDGKVVGGEDWIPFSTKELRRAPAIVGGEEYNKKQCIQKAASLNHAPAWVQLAADCGGGTVQGEENDKKQCIARIET